MDEAFIDTVHKKVNALYKERGYLITIPRGAVAAVLEAEDACFKCIVAKLDSEGIHFHLSHFADANYICRLFKKPYDVAAVSEAETPLLALCLAVEKLIDNDACVMSAEENKEK